MANTSISLTSIDFDTLKSNFQSYLTNQSIFKDYNFDASNMAVLIDLLSYNTYLNSFYLNMVASEMFLDTAQKLDSVVSHAKELNYVPQSAKSAVANISLTLTTTGITSPLTITKGTAFSGQNSNGVFQFVTSDNRNYTSPNNIFQVINLPIYEGVYTSDVYVVDYTNPTQSFVLTNQNIDTDSISVIVTESGVNTEFTQVSTLFGLSNTSNVYFLQAAQNQQYEIVFGDGLLGRIPNNLSVVNVTYRITNGDAAQGISSFQIISDIGVENGGSVVPPTVIVNANSGGGSIAEGIESIRKSAPRYFATQQRAVASDDYSALVLDQFGGEISDVNVYGGELLTPKQYGSVAVCLKPASGTIAPDFLKNQIITYLSTYTSLPVTVKITDPDYIYIGITSTVQYDSTGTTKSAEEIQSIVLNDIANYNSTNLGVFNNDFRFSRFSATIDNSDQSIVSNNTEISIIKRISPLLNYSSSFKLDFNNAAEVENRNNAQGYTAGPPFYDEPALTSSAFTYVDSKGNQYPNSYIRDNNFGVLVVYSDINGVFTVLNNNIGTIDYVNGIAIISNFMTSYYNQYISIYLNPQSNDVLAQLDKIALIDLADVSVNVISKLQ
jgi:hypothetical protein